MPEEIKIKTGNIIGSTGVLNINSILHHIDTSVGQIRAHGSDGRSKEVADLCDELKDALSSAPDLSSEDKADALDKVAVVAEATASPEDDTMIGAARRALGALSGMLNVFPETVQGLRATLTSLGRLFGLSL